MVLSEVIVIRVVVVQVQDIVEIQVVMGGIGMDFSAIFGTDYGENGWFVGGGGMGSDSGANGTGGQGGGGNGANSRAAKGGMDGTEGGGGGA